MSISISYRMLFLWTLIGGGLCSVEAQLQFPGTPMGNSDQLKAADVMYVLPPLDPFQIESAIQSNHGSELKPFQFALERFVDLSPESHGSWETQGQYRIWRVHIISPGARSLGLVFNQYILEPGVKVFVYDPDQLHIKGAFTSGNNKTSGILPVGHIAGEEIIIEMQVHEHLAGYGVLGIESVSHAFLDIKHRFGSADCSPGEFGCSQTCEIDVNCTEGDEWQLTKRSVVRVFTQSQYCTGVLVNNTSYDGTPYILTAEHCINKQAYADRTVFQFNYESPSCFGEDGPLNMSISGAELITVGDSLDFSLVKLSLTPPDNFDAFYAGWDRSDFQTSATTTIHHPYGDVKKISSDYEAPSIPAQPGDVPYNDLDDYHYFSFWWIRGWDVGSTEGGSSGCPLFNGAQRLIGTLSGGIARCGDSIGYDYDKNRVIYNQAFNYDDYYTRMSMAWDYNGGGPSLKPWLDPGNTGIVSLGGYHPTNTATYPVVSGRHFTLFPNPVTHELFISSRDKQGGLFSYHIYSHSGTLVLSGNLDNGGSVRIETGTLSSGMYLILLEGSGIQETHKFIVIR